jgi:hypothetical protein
VNDFTWTDVRIYTGVKTTANIYLTKRDCVEERQDEDEGSDKRMDVSQ